MFASRAIRQSSRCIGAARPCIKSHVVSSFKPINITRPITSSTKLYKEDKRSAKDVFDGDTAHEGSFSRTDNTVSFVHPEEHEMPRSSPVQGRGGLHFKRTLASFSLEGRVGVVTGGARGLGLVMSQALVISGADVAIVDLNSKLDLLKKRSRTYMAQRMKEQDKPNCSWTISWRKTPGRRSKRSVPFVAAQSNGHSASPK